VPARALHVSDLHAGRRETPGLAAALGALADDVDPELALATGDLAHRGRPAQLAAARELLGGLGRPLLAVPGNHDIPYTFPARFTRPWSAFESAFGDELMYRSERLLVCGLNSVRPWRHQGGRVPPRRLATVAESFAAAPEGSLRVVALHHHLAGAPWHTARKLPLKHRERVLATLAAAGADLVVGGHIHQATVIERLEFQTHDGTAPAPVVLTTAPGLGRPRPHRSGESQGALVYEWDEDRLAIVTYAWSEGRFERRGRREFWRR
jgi:3',5'-cyclic AMP phosphodiesterase CpdA